MNCSNNIFKTVCTIFVLLMILTGASCSYNDNEPAGSSVPVGSHIPADIEYPDYDFTEAVSKVTSSAEELIIKSYLTNHQFMIDKERPEFNAIIDYISKATVTRSQPRFVENEGKTVEATVLHSIGYVLYFKLSDGSGVLFDFGGDIWFNAADMIYGASVDAAMFELVQQLAGD